MKRSQLKTLPSNRSGAHLVEMALVLPLVFTFTFAVVEFSRVNMILNTMENACYEGARKAITPGASASQASTETQRLLDILGVTGETITITPTTITDSTETVTVAVSVPLQQNTYAITNFFTGITVSRSCTLNREIVEN